MIKCQVQQARRNTRHMIYLYIHEIFNIAMKILALFTILSAMCFACSTHQNVIQMENFNIVLMSTKVGDRINLKQGSIEYYKRLDVADVNFTLDSVEMNRIFTSVPWHVLADLPNYYNPIYKCKDSLDDQNVFELVIMNGHINKTIRLNDCDDFESRSIQTDQILECIKTTHNIVREKSLVKPLIEIDI
jgi:hypothetical protein